MKPYAELLEFNQPNPVRKPGFTRIRDAFEGLSEPVYHSNVVNLFIPLDSDDCTFFDPERIMEFAGRWDYGPKNAAKLGETVKMNNPEPVGMPKIDVSILRKYIGMGHESMIEMGDATFFIECSRVVSHELVRHRLASFQQESQRFVKYDDIDAEKDMYYPESLEGVEGIYHLEEPAEYIEPVIIPGYTITEGIPAYDAMLNHYDNSLDLYKELRAKGVPPQDARYVLPNGMSTRIIIKANMREWRHILRLRLDKSAQPEMQELMQQVYDQLKDIFPNVMNGVLTGERGVR